MAKNLHFSTRSIIIMIDCGILSKKFAFQDLKSFKNFWHRSYFSMKIVTMFYSEPDFTFSIYYSQLFVMILIKFMRYLLKNSDFIVLSVL